MSNLTHLKYVQVHEEWFYYTDGSMNDVDAHAHAHTITDFEVVAFKPDVRVLSITEINKGKPCVIIER